MDISYFVNSSDIREYHRKINYDYSPVESAWLISRCMHITLTEKLEAFKQLITETDDCEIKDWPSLHEFLLKFIKATEGFYEDFKKQEIGAAYKYRHYCTGDHGWYEDKDLYASESDCWKDMEEDFDLDIEIIEITKCYIGESRQLTVWFNPSREAMHIYHFFYVDDETSKIFDTFDDLWFNFPVPFEIGDVVAEKMKPGPREYFSATGPLVVKGMTPFYHEENLKRDPDTLGMYAWGFFQDPDGRVYREVMSNYMDLEYYKGPFEGVKRLLIALSNHVKGKLSLETLLTAYRKVIIDEFAKDVMLYSWFCDEDLEAAGLGDFVKEKNAKKHRNFNLL